MVFARVRKTGAADYYGIDGGFGCAPKGAQYWWIHEAKPCASPGSCCTAADYTKHAPPYPGCGKKGPATVPEQDIAGFLLIRGPYAYLGHGKRATPKPCIH
jgi:hypothetical protein